jgi:hypothetical protein
MDFVALQASGLETRYAAYELSLTGVTVLEPVVSIYSVDTRYAASR